MLKVKDDEVVGFEPWYEFPFNQGKLCPKGVKRYLQNDHPDRLLDAARARPDAPGGFRPVDVGPRAGPHGRRRSDASRQRTATTRSRMLSGVSLDNEKSYLIGKFARLALGTANLDYNGRLCMVSAGVGQQAGLRHRPRRQPLERHPAGRCGVRHRRQHRRVRADHDD